MPRIWLGNFDFETVLAGETPAKEVQRISAELAFALLPIAEQGDVIIVADEFDGTFLNSLQSELGLPSMAFCKLKDVPNDRDDWELTPWGWTPVLLDLARSRHWLANAPATDVVRRVHSREFSYQLSDQLGVQPPGVQCVQSESQLDAILSGRTADMHWVVKSQWTASGRGQIRRRGNSLSEQDRRWIAHHLHRDGCVFWEPWFDTIAEVGIQWTVPPYGEPKLEAIVPMLTDRHGQYIGSSVPACGDQTLASEWRDAVEVGRQVCERLQTEGYFGPVGIDAMRYCDEQGKVRLRPIQEINARWTMGRLAAAWRRYLPLACEAQWLLNSTKAPRPTSRLHRSAATSPTVLDGKAMRLQMELRWDCGAD